MRFKVTCEVSETELMKISSMARKIIPLYKSKAEAADISWIHENKETIVDAACEYIWNLYCEAFTDDMILSRNKFYELIRSELNLESKMVRFTDDVIKYSFARR